MSNESPTTVAWGVITRNELASMTNRVARMHGAFYRGILMSLLLLWCTSFSLLPAHAAADATPQPSSACACCNPTSGTTEHASSVVCNVLPHAVVNDLTLPLGTPVILAAAHSVLFEWEDVAAPLRAAPPPLAGPPLYLRLLRLLI
jgi:hypothetical protein